MHKKFWTQNPNRKVGAPRPTLDDNTKTDPKERVWERADWSDLAPGTVEQRAVLNTVMNIQLPPNAQNTLTIRGTQLSIPPHAQLQRHRLKFI